MAQAFALAVVNEASVPQADIDAFVPAAREFIQQWLTAFWPDVAGTTIRAVPPGASAITTEAAIILAPNTTQAGSLGYHDKTAAGLPTGIIELDSCRRYGVPWTIAATHEIAELLIDPFLTEFVDVATRSYPKEIADPTTAGHFMIGSVPVANVTTPAYWDPHSPAGSRFDLMGLVKAPLPAIPEKGWLEWCEGGEYSNAWGPQMPAQHIAYMAERHGRRWRRRTQGGGR